ncbi:hypothetical protein AB0L05_27930 [Nonomuraea pusilla]
MAKKPTPPPSGRQQPELPWLPPGTASTWICPGGPVNPRSTTTCGSCS